MNIDLSSATTSTSLNKILVAQPNSVCLYMDKKREGM